MSQQASKILDLARDLCAVHNLPGLSAAWICHDGGVERIVCGWANRETKIPMTPDHRMLAGSVGKTFTAATALRLVQAGTVQLDAPISRVLDGETWFERLPNGPALTLRHLLNHRGGLPDHRGLPEFAERLVSELSGPSANCDLVISPTSLIGMILDKPPLFAVGEGYCYSETGFILAGVVLEMISGRNYYELVDEFFIEPFELTMTDAANRRALDGLAQGYVEPNPHGFPELTLKDDQLAVNPATEWTGGGFVSTPTDLALWAKRLYEGAAMPAPYLDQMLDGAPIERVPNGAALFTSYGLGTYIWRHPFGRSFGHGGEAPGYRSAAAYFEEQRLAVAVQVNSSIPPSDLIVGLPAQIAQRLF